MTERPMRDMLLRVSGRMTLHMPGAQRRSPFGRINAYRLETTELPVTDDLYDPLGAIAKAEALAAQSAGAAATLMLTGGSTAGVHAMLMYAARRGETVILPRTAHLSAVNACAVTGIKPVFAKACVGTNGIPYVPLASYLDAMDENPEAKAVLVTRPDYYGALGEAESVFAAARAHSMLSLCDEAHGACFNWDSSMVNAGACSADIFVQSAHKTLPALNGCAWLHAMNGIDADRLRLMLRMTQSSSPSFVSLMALDDARAWMHLHGKQACGTLHSALDGFRKHAAALGYSDGQDEPGMSYDTLRLVLNAPQGGYRLAAELAARHIDVEMADDRRIVCILSLINGAKRLRRLERALARIPAQGADSAAESRTYPIDLPPRDMPLDIAAFAPCEKIRISQAVGRISAGHIGLYPPGVALVTAGERITADAADYISNAPPAAVFGVYDGGAIRCVMEESGK